METGIGKMVVSKTLVSKREFQNMNCWLGAREDARSIPVIAERTQTQSLLESFVLAHESYF